MCHTVCFEAGRFTQTQSSWTALRRSRKWMSGHADADALAQSATDRKQQIVQQLVGPITALQKALPSAGEVLFSLDKPLSWMSPLPLYPYRPGAGIVSSAVRSYMVMPAIQRASQ
jgi:hypothetical protein